MPAPGTPYDITPPPLFAYEPGLREWLLLAGVFAVIFVILTLASRYHRKKGTPEAVTLALSELRRIRGDKAAVLTKERIAQISLVIKRLASSVLNAPIAQFSSRELSQYVAGVEQPTMRALLERILTLDDYKYRPDSAELPSSAIIGEIIETVERLQSETRSPA